MNIGNLFERIEEPICVLEDAPVYAIGIPSQNLLSAISYFENVDVDTLTFSSIKNIAGSNSVLSAEIECGGIDCRWEFGPCGDDIYELQRDDLTSNDYELVGKYNARTQEWET